MSKDEFILCSLLDSIKIIAEAMSVLAEKFLFQRERIKLNKNEVDTLRSAEKFIETAEKGEKSFVEHTTKDCHEDDILAYLLCRHTNFGLEMKRDGEITPPTISGLKSTISGMKDKVFVADGEIEQVKLFFSYLAKGIPS